MLQLRGYQQAAVDEVFSYWQSEPGNPLIDLATGTGKSLVAATLIQRLIEGWPSLRIIVATHVAELIEQDYSELVSVWPFAPAGIYSAGLNRRDHRSQILFAGIQTVWNKVDEICGARTIGGAKTYTDPVDILLVDEAHLIPFNTETTYRRFIDALRVANPDLKIVGLTATPFRLDSGRLDEGDDRLFDKVIYSYGIADGVREGYLSPLSSKATATSFDLTGVHRQGGDYKQTELQSAVDKTEVTRAAAAEIVSKGADRRSWLIFGSGVDHAIHIRDELRSHGISCETITGNTPKGERRKIIEDFKSYNIRAITNNSVLTTGFSHKGVDLIAFMRPTLSAGLYLQMAGRGTRVLYAPGANLDTTEGRLAGIASGPKPSCLVLDFAGIVARHGPVDKVVPKKPTKGESEAPVKLCPDCAEIVHISVMTCPACGYIFPPSEDVKITASPSSAPVLSTDDPWQPVLGQTYAYHDKVGGTPSVRCEYTLDNKRVEKTWICPQHGGPEFTGRAKAKADRYWRYHGGNMPFPDTVDEFLDRVGELNVTAQIKVKYVKRGMNDVTEWQAGEGKVSAAPVGNLDIRPKRRPANDNHANDNLSLLGRMHIDSRPADEDFIPF